MSEIEECTGISRRHRRWGFDYPAGDTGLVLLEHDNGEASAIVEYKHEHSSKEYISHPAYQTVIDLGDKAGIPVIACRYSHDYSRYNVTPLNWYAKNFISEPKELSESEWVRLLYKIRGREVSDEFLESMNITI